MSDFLRPLMCGSQNISRNDIIIAQRKRIGNTKKYFNYTNTVFITQGNHRVSL
jgi:hypothetical protein